MAYKISPVENEGYICNNKTKTTCHDAERAVVEKQKHNYIDKTKDSNRKAMLTMRERRNVFSCNSETRKAEPGSLGRYP